MRSRERRDREFSDYVAARSSDLKRAAYLLCGDAHRAEDLVQTALTKLYVSWEKVERRGAMDAYVRQILVRTAIDESRRPWRREVVVETTPDGVTSREGGDDDSLMAELAQLPPRQRAAVVLRYWNVLSVEETARLDCTPSAVKTHCSRGLDRLRTLLTTTPGGA